MDEKVRQQAKAKLGVLIAKVLEDGVIDAGERESLQGFFRDALLTVSDVKAVYLDSVGALQAEVLADGVVTAEEARRCKLVVGTAPHPFAHVASGDGRDRHRASALADAHLRAAEAARRAAARFGRCSPWGPTCGRPAQSA